MYKQPMVTIELEEYQQLKKTIEHLSKPAEGSGLTENEHQEATGLLLVRALENPGLFRNAGSEGGTPIQLGKFKAIFGFINDVTSIAKPKIYVKFVRT